MLKNHSHSNKKQNRLVFCWLLLVLQLILVCHENCIASNNFIYLKILFKWSLSNAKCSSYRVLFYIGINFFKIGKLSLTLLLRKWLWSFHARSSQVFCHKIKGQKQVSWSASVVFVNKKYTIDTFITHWHINLSYNYCWIFTVIWISIIP